MKHLNFKIKAIILGLIFASYFSVSSAYALIDNGGGSGPILDAPTNVLANSITATSAEITWEQPPTNPPTTTYRIFATPADQTSLGDSTGTTLLLTNLTPDTDYDYWIGAFDSDNQLGAMTQIPTFHTASNTPSNITDPTLFTTTASTTNSITLQWDTNNSATGTVYQISGNNITTTTATSTDIGIMSATISNLPNPDVQYTFNIQSQNLDGTLNSVVSVSDYTKAANPINLIASNITTSTLTLSWEANGNPSTTMYLVSDAVNSLGVASTTTFNAISLTPSTSYTFSVLSTNNNNDNSPNSPISITVSTLPENNSDNGGGGSGGNSNTQITNNQINDAVEKLISFLKKNQESDGKIIDGGISDWAAISFGAKGIYADDVKNGDKSLYNFIYNYNFTDASDINTCASYPRHILALLSAGTATSDSKITDLKNKVNSQCVKDGKFGQDGINDDVFGLMALLAVGEDSSTPAVSAALNGIKADQQEDGSFTWSGWPGADMTGAAINALRYAQSKGAAVNENIFTKAKQYLKSQQLTDGGWGSNPSDALTTGWAVMGINAIGETQNSWFNAAGKNPWYILTTLNDDHYVQSWDNGIDWFATKHAIPALLGKSWPIILTPKSTQSSGGSVEIFTPPTSTTSTIITTTTISITTLAVTSTTSTEEISTTTIYISEIIPTSTDDKLAIITKKITPQFKKTQNVANQTSLSSGPTSTDKNQIVDELPLDTSTKRNVKKLLAVSGGGALAIGFYLARKLIKKVI